MTREKSRTIARQSVEPTRERALGRDPHHDRVLTVAWHVYLPLGAARRSRHSTQYREDGSVRSHDPGGTMHGPKRWGLRTLAVAAGLALATGGLLATSASAQSGSAPGVSDDAITLGFI